MADGSRDQRQSAKMLASPDGSICEPSGFQVTTLLIQQQPQQPLPLGIDGGALEINAVRCAVCQRQGVVIRLRLGGATYDATTLLPNGRSEILSDEKLAWRVLGHRISGLDIRTRTFGFRSSCCAAFALRASNCITRSVTRSVRHSIRRN